MILWIPYILRATYFTYFAHFLRLSKALGCKIKGMFGNRMPEVTFAKVMTKNAKRTQLAS